MRRRLLSSTVLIALAAVVVLGVPLGVVGGRLIRRDARAQLENEADAVVAAVERDLAAGRRPTSTQLAALLKPRRRVIVTTPGQALSAGSPLRGARLRVSEPVGRGATVTLVAPAAEASEHAHQVWLIVGLLAAAGVALAVLLALVQARHLARPLEHLAAVSHRLGTGDFSVRAGRHGVAEIDQVAEALDQTAARVARLIAGERQFTANVSHQLRTPLTALQLRLEEIHHAPDTAAAHDEAAAALAQAERLERTIADLLILARAPAGTQRQDGDRSDRGDDFEDIEVGTLVAQHAATWTPVFAGAERTLTINTRPHLRAHTTPGALGQALDVLLENALRQCTQRVDLSVRPRDSQIVISISDDGPGVPLGLEERIFDRHISFHGGTGLGLAVARALTELDGGTLRLARPRPASFEIILPAASARVRPGSELRHRDW